MDDDLATTSKNKYRKVLEDSVKQKEKERPTEQKRMNTGQFLRSKDIAMF